MDDNKVIARFPAGNYSSVSIVLDGNVVSFDGYPQLIFNNTHEIAIRRAEDMADTIEIVIRESRPMITDALVQNINVAPLFQEQLTPHLVRLLDAAYHVAKGDRIVGMELLKFTAICVLRSLYSFVHNVLRIPDTNEAEYLKAFVNNFLNALEVYPRRQAVIDGILKKTPRDEDNLE